MHVPICRTHSARRKRNFTRGLPPWCQAVILKTLHVRSGVNSQDVQDVGVRIRGGVLGRQRRLVAGLMDSGQHQSARPPRPVGAPDVHVCVIADRHDPERLAPSQPLALFPQRRFGERVDFWARLAKHLCRVYRGGGVRRSEAAAEAVEFNATTCRIRGPCSSPTCTWRARRTSKKARVCVSARWWVRSYALTQEIPIPTASPGKQPTPRGRAATCGTRCSTANPAAR